MKGCYALVISLERDEDIDVGSLGVIRFSKGYYLYIGSAMNGIEGRVRRHLRMDKTIHWHIDYLLKSAEIMNVYYKVGHKGLECSLAGACSQISHPVPGFGSSDCSCCGHLFFGNKKEFTECMQTNGMKRFHRKI